MKCSMFLSRSRYFAGSSGLLGGSPRRYALQGIVLAAALVMGAPIAGHAESRHDAHSMAVATWAVPMVSANPTNANRINNQTLRQIARISIGGDRVRVRLSNRWGSAPLVIGGAAVALRDSEQNIVAGTSKALTFGGESSFTIPAYSELVSDWVDFEAADLAELAIDVYLPNDTMASTSPLTVRNGSLQTTYVSATGDHTGASEFPVASTRVQWNFLAAVDVTPAHRTGTVLAFGDSITEGLRATRDANRRWPDVLANRLMLLPESQQMGVANLGISGNRVWSGGGSTNPSALARFNHALVQPRATHVIVLLGINDLNGGATAEQVIGAHRQLIARAHTQGLKIYGGTLTPFGRASDTVEARRQAVNEWIRTSGEFDGVVDFDAALADPENPRWMLPLYDSGDALHPSDAGYEAMGNAVDLTLLKVTGLAKAR